jgi:hypothetical protein
MLPKVPRFTHLGVLPRECGLRMSLKSRSEYVTVLRGRYRGASDRVEKSWIIDEFVNTLAWATTVSTRFERLTPTASPVHRSRVGSAPSYASRPSPVHRILRQEIGGVLRESL